jgi:hypothetical protein
MGFAATDGQELELLAGDPDENRDFSSLDSQEALVRMRLALEVMGRDGRGAAP